MQKRNQLSLIFEKTHSVENDPTPYFYTWFPILVHYQATAYLVTLPNYFLSYYIKEL